MNTAGKAIASLLFLALACLASSANAVLIEWQLTTTFDDNSATTDPLGIDGERLTINLTFDTADQWQLIAPFLYVAATAASASISDGTSVTLVAALPAAGHEPGNLDASLLQDVGNSSFMDLVIDGALAQGGGLQGTSAGIANAGDNLQADHLLSAFTGNQQLTGNTASGASFSYLLVDSTITVPAPTVFALMIIGAVAGGFRRRRRNSAA